MLWFLRHRICGHYWLEGGDFILFENINYFDIVIRHVPLRDRVIKSQAVERHTYLRDAELFTIFSHWVISEHVIGHWYIDKKCYCRTVDNIALAYTRFFDLIVPTRVSVSVLCDEAARSTRIKSGNQNAGWDAFPGASSYLS